MLAVLLALSLGSNTEDAVAAFKRGRELLAAGRLAEACAAFEESHRLDPALGALLNLAECTAQLNDAPKAFSLYGEVLAWASRKNDEPRVKVARDRLTALRPKLALALVDTPVGVAVAVDRKPVTTGQTIPLEPGAHVVELTQPDGTKDTRTLVVTAGQALTLSTPTPPAPVEVPPKTTESTPAVQLAPSPPPSRASAAPVVLLVSGLGVALAGGIVTGWAVDVWNRGEAQRQGGPLTVSLETYRTAGTAYPVGLGALLGGSALAVSGLLWWLLWK